MSITKFIFVLFCLTLFSLILRPQVSAQVALVATAPTVPTLATVPTVSTPSPTRTPTPTVTPTPTFDPSALTPGVEPLTKKLWLPLIVTSK